MSCVKSQPCHSRGGNPVLPISLPYIYQLAAALKPLSGLTYNTAIKDSMWMLFNAESELEAFLYGSVYSKTLKATASPGQVLLQAIKKLTTDANKDRLLDFMDTYSVTNALVAFETVLTAEMNVCPAYFITKQRGYDVSDLITQAEVLFPAELIAKVPEAIPDIQQAGKCIAFEIPTAAGFHLMRALELVLRLYFDAVCKGEPRPNTNNMGDYLATMTQKGLGDPKAIAVLKQIKDLHRNEFIHPETTLSLDEAIGLLGIAQSAIVYMLAVIPEKQLKLTAGTVVP
jgi:hypothetical protein